MIFIGLKMKRKWKKREAVDLAFQKAMLGTLPPMNWSQISKEIPSSLVIMSHRKWDSGEDGNEEQGRGSQTSITTILKQGVRITSLLRPWSTMTMTESKLLSKGRFIMRSMERFWKGWESSNTRGVMVRMVGWVSILCAWQTAFLEMNFQTYSITIFTIFFHESWLL